MKDAIGRNLKIARELAGLRQEVFADQIGVSRATLSAIENSHVSIDSGVLLRAANLLGRPVSDFFKVEPEEMALLYRAAVDIAAPSDAKLEFERSAVPTASWNTWSELRTTYSLRQPTITSRTSTQNRTTLPSRLRPQSVTGSASASRSPSTTSSSCWMTRASGSSSRNEGL